MPYRRSPSGELDRNYQNVHNMTLSPVADILYDAGDCQPQAAPRCGDSRKSVCGENYARIYTASPNSNKAA